MLGVTSSRISRARQNFNLLYRQPADSARTVSHLHPVIAPVEHGQFRAILRFERVLRLGKGPAARRGFRFNDHRGWF